MTGKQTYLWRELKISSQAKIRWSAQLPQRMEARKKTYTITVTRGGDSSAEETEPSAEASSPEGTPHNVEDGNWTVAETFDAETLPEAFL